MAFDAGMVFAISTELNNLLGEENGFGGSRVDKILMPERDEIHLVLHKGRESERLVLSASSATPRIHLTKSTKENPATPPAFCMLLRKHLLSSRLKRISQIDFERVIELEFDFKDELQDTKKKYLIIEIMGKHSNLIFCDGEKRILGAIRTNDLSDTTKRPIFAGVKYTLPPKQEKLDPKNTSKEEFLQAISTLDPNTPADKAINALYLGIAPLVAREIVFRATGNTDTTLELVRKERLWTAFEDFYAKLFSENFTPTLLLRPESSLPFEYSFCEIFQYGSSAVSEKKDSVSETCDTYFTNRDKAERIKQRSQDIKRLLSTAESRLLKKIEIQERELRDTDDMELFKKWADLISQEMYRIKRGDRSVTATDYTTEPYSEVTVDLDEKLAPSQNAQRYYKKYARAKKARVELAEQIRKAKEELLYIDAVSDALSRATLEQDLDEIREELSMWGYAKRDKSHLKSKTPKKKLKPIKVISPSGFEVYIGKNNLQNDYLTTKFAEKSDWWFHTKNYAGSHVIMKAPNGEPPAEDFTFAASLAALHSSADGENVAVDYTQIRYVKKPASSKPGFVTYTTYWTAYVTPDEKALYKSLEMV